MEKNKMLVIAAAVLVIAAGAGWYLLAGQQDTDADIVIGCGTKNCYEPFWIADKYGYFNDENVKVKTMYVDGGGSATTALLAGQVDLTLVGADPAIRMFDKTADGMAIAAIEVSKGVNGRDFAALKEFDIDLADPAASLLNSDGTVRVHTGLDRTTGYYSGYISYLHSAMQEGKLTEDQYNLLKTVKTDRNDGGIVHVEFNLQVTALLKGTVQMLCSGNTVSLAETYADVVEVLSSPYPDVVGFCVVIASGNAIANKSDSLVKVLRALDRACAYIENPETKPDAARYCAEFYGAEGWTEKSQTAFFNANYWDICYLKDVEKFLNLKAAILGYDKMDCTDRVTDRFLAAIHEDNLYLYDSVTGKLGPMPLKQNA